MRVGAVLNDGVGAVVADALRMARFARGALRFRARADDIYISSYPRSGTTWMQYIVHVLVHGGDTGFEHISQVAPWYERSLALGQRTATDFAHLPGPRVFKSHLPHAWLPRGGRCIYVVRDGRDVAVSYHQLYRSHLGSTEDFDRFFDRFLRGRVQYGSWFDHVAAWQAVQHRPDVCLVSYEALTTQLPREMQRLSEFLGLTHERARVAELAELCSFDAMKRTEERFDHATAEAKGARMSNGTFLRQGRTGAHHAVLRADQRERFEHSAQRPASPARWHQLHAFLH